MSYTDKDTIFVQIASYRDPELQHTLQDLFAKAKRPENIFVGVCYQHDMDNKDDEDVFKIPSVKPDQIRVFECDYRENWHLGLSWSRSQAQKFYKCEKWTLVCDSHMRFKDGWDDILVSGIKECDKNGKGVVFGNWPGSYDPETNELAPEEHPCGVAIVTNYLLGIKVPHVQFTYPVTKITPGCAFIGCFFFSDAEVIAKNPPDQKVEFFEEMTSSIKYFMFGANVYQFNKSVIGHLWRSRRKVKENDGDHQEVTYKSSKFSNELFLHFIGNKKSNCSEIIKSAIIFDHQKKRTLKDYARFSGLDLRLIKARERTRNGIFEKWQEVANISKVKNVFKVVVGV